MLPLPLTTFISAVLLHIRRSDTWVLNFDRNSLIIKPTTFISILVDVGDNGNSYHTPPAALLLSKTVIFFPAARRWPALTTPLMPAPMIATRWIVLSDIMFFTNLFRR